MEPDSPEEEFIASSNFYSVTIPEKEAALYLQRILKSKEYDIDNIFNQFYLSFIAFVKSQNFDIGTYLLSLLKNLKDIHSTPIISKKLIQALEAAATALPDKISLLQLKPFLMDKWKQIEPEALEIFVKVFKLEISNNELEEYISELWKVTEWRKAVILSARFALAKIIEEKFSVLDLLVKRDETELINVFIHGDKELAALAVSKMCTNKHSKIAGKIVDTAGLNPLDFPMLLERLNKTALRYFLNNDDMCVYQLIELTYDMPAMLGIIIEDLEFQGKKFRDSWQIGLASFLVHKFPAVPVRDQIKNALLKISPRHALGPSAVFSSLQPELDLTLELPRESVLFIDTLDKLNSMQWTGNLAGIDCEWRPSLVRFQKTKVAIMQIAFENIVYIVDMLALNACPELDEKLSSLMQSEIYKLGVSFEGDRKMLKQSYPNLTAFQKEMVNYVDVVGAYAKVEGKSPGGLAGACELVIGRTLCKYEQRSNWENRPLRESQMHYAALDAYVQILIVKRLVEKSGMNIQEFVGETNRGKAGASSCNFCGSKIHAEKQCHRGARCKLCYKHGHKAARCPN